MSGIYRVLFVCTGNICRSPFAERLLRARLDAKLGDAANRIEVTSAGSYGLVGEPMMPETAKTLVRYGGDGTGFVARAIDVEHVERADLVLGLTREHRAAVLTMVPRASSRTMTLREFARLLGGVTAADLPSSGADVVERFRAITVAAFGRRGYAPPKALEDDDVPDPFGGSMAGDDKAAAMIDKALDVPLSLLVG